VFEFFVLNEWIYESKRVKELIDFMSPEERKCFIVDAADIDIDYFLVVNNYGLQKYILKENVELPSP
jgi:fatty acyl-CoA reductase